ncbi:MAG: M56 family metallopeptidase, partial [Planctomycetaceae bacterium]|nr:M56 family metallopeptidase [Planctomycetaceae bacterium]
MTSILHNLLQQPQIHLLSQTSLLTLLHSLWLGCLVAVCSAAFHRTTSHCSPVVRYRIQVGLLTAFCGCVFVTWLVIYWQQVNIQLARTVAAQTTDVSAAPGLTRSADIVETQRSIQVSGPGTSSHSKTGEAAFDLPDPASFMDAELSSTNTSVHRESPFANRSALLAASGADGRSAETTRQQYVTEFAPHLTTIYLAGVIAMLLRLATSMVSVHRLRSRAAAVIDRQALLMLKDAAVRIGVRNIPRLCQSTDVAMPMVIGIVRPMLLIPTAMLLRMSPDDLQCVLMHELSHVRRWDLLVNLYQRLAESLFFFHPAVWYLSRRISYEREQCCDDLVVRNGAERMQYVNTLLMLAEWYAAARANSIQLQLQGLRASGGGPSELSVRLHRLL